ncbi:MULTISPECIES: DUF2887 domain-containing protein [Cyanophyceae]|uniref:DUF2887 domain-containing protein n=1 Tax=Cyanophyceae TaxID=3028117 RepID=UPI001684598D|nr:DUF2887 domain-containing protein [Trichocoleus sp. FACHB-40]
MRTATIFYRLFKTLTSLLFELIGKPPTQAQSYQFCSKEIKKLSRSFDSVFLPPNFHQVRCTLDIPKFKPVETDFSS